MVNLVEVSINRMLNNVIDRAIREALLLELKATEEAQHQKQKMVNGEDYNFSASNALREGVGAICQILQKMFGGLPIDSVNAIGKIVRDNEGDSYLGCDSRDYVKLFIETLDDQAEMKAKHPKIKTRTDAGNTTYYMALGRLDFAVNGNNDYSVEVKKYAADLLAAMKADFERELRKGGTMVNEDSGIQGNK